MTAIVHLPRSTWLERTLTATGEALVRTADHSRVRRSGRPQTDHRTMHTPPAPPMDDCIVRAWRSGLR